MRRHRWPASQRSPANTRARELLRRWHAELEPEPPIAAYSIRTIAAATGLSSTTVYQIERDLYYEDEDTKQIAIDAQLPILERRIQYLPLSAHLLNALAFPAPGGWSPYYGPQWRGTGAPPTPRLELVGDLLPWAAEDLLELYNFGRGALAELEHYLNAEGIRIVYRPPSGPPPVREIYEKCPVCGGSGRTGRRVPAPGPRITRELVARVAQGDAP